MQRTALSPWRSTAKCTSSQDTLEDLGSSISYITLGWGAGKSMSITGKIFTFQEHNCFFTRVQVIGYTELRSIAEYIEIHMYNMLKSLKKHIYPIYITLIYININQYKPININQYQTNIYQYKIWVNKLLI